MIIIEKIEIRNFRSIKRLDLNLDSSISILSGVNSCGKTNILRALNLFFNNEVGFGKKISVSDFYTEKDKQTSLISIKVYFNSYVSDRIKIQRKVPEKFSIKREFVFRAGFFSENITYEGVTEKQEQYCNDFLTKWIRFHYIPTDRKVFFERIHDELSEFLGSPYGYNILKSQFEGLKDDFNNIEKSLNTRDFTQLELSEELKKRLDILKVGYALPEVRNLLKVLDFAITRNSGEKSFVSTEGDGVKFINLLQILEIFDSRYLKESRNRPYASIWAIDEPENSLEQKNIELFSHELLQKHSINKQIFLTSHSPEFLLEPDKVGRNRFYGFDKINGETKEITDKSQTLRLPLTEFERQMLIDKMGIGMTREEKLELISQIKMQADELTKTGKIIKDSQKPIVIIEDSYDQIYKIAWLKINNVKFNVNNLTDTFEKKCKKFIFLPSHCSNELQKLLELVSIEVWLGKKVLGIFDFDGAYNNFNGLNKDLWGKTVGIETDGLYKKRNNSNIAALLLPVPSQRSQYADRTMGGSSSMSVELYFSDQTLKGLGCLGEEQISGVIEKRKIFIGDKSVFWKKLFALQPADFVNFKPLFAKIDELLK